VHETIRGRVAALDRDRPPSPDIEAIDRLIAIGAIEHASGIVVN